MKIAQYSQKTNTGSRNNKSFQREIWDEIWSKNSFYDLVAQLSQNATYWDLKKLLKPKDLILEAGCGYGQWVYQLTIEGYKIKGIDNASKTIEKIKKTHPGLKVQLGDVEKLPFLSNSFNCYLSFGVIEHFEKGPEKVLAEAYRVLKPGGLLFLTVPYLNLFRFIRFGLIAEKKGKFYQYLYSPFEIKTIINKSGFKISSAKGYDFYTAFKKDFPFLFSILNKFIKLNPKVKNSNKENNRVSSVQPNLKLANFLYKIDSYILLVVAYKSK